MSDPRWIDETIHEKAGVRYGLRVKQVLIDERTGHQGLVLFENESFGRVLVLDGAVQLTERDEFVYHEMMAHVPVLAHGNAERVLIIGGGDGGIAEEALKHASVKALTLVDIDEGVVEFSRRHLSSVNKGCFDDPRFHLHIGDGAAYVRETQERFDVVIVDSTDPVGPSLALYTPEFYAGCRRCLRPGGVLVTQSGSPLLQGGEISGCIRDFLNAGFEDAASYLAAVPTYFGGFFALGWATDAPETRRVPEATLTERFAASGIEGLRYYTPAVHRAAFALPPYVSDLVAQGRADAGA